MPVCSRCRRDLPEEAFYPDRTHPTRDHTSECKECRALSVKEWQNTHEEEFKEMVALWRDENRDHYNKVAREWREANPEAHEAIVRRFRERHPHYIPEKPPKIYTDADGNSAELELVKEDGKWKVNFQKDM